MAFSSFTAFLDALDRAGELTRVPVPVATELEITEWADREMKAPGGGKALLFEKPTVNGKVSSTPLAINTLGSRKRMAMSLGLESIDQLADEMRLLVKAKPPTSLKSAWKLAMQGLSLLHAKPKHVSDGPCKEVVHRFDGTATASELPTLSKWCSMATLEAIHHVPVRAYARPGHRRAQPRYVSDAGL